jgi:hypothetical protein
MPAWFDADSVKSPTLHIMSLLEVWRVCKSSESDSWLSKSWDLVISYRWLGCCWGSDFFTEFSEDASLNTSKVGTALLDLTSVLELLFCRTYSGKYTNSWLLSTNSLMHSVILLFYAGMGDIDLIGSNSSGSYCWSDYFENVKRLEPCKWLDFPVTVGWPLAGEPLDW